MSAEDDAARAALLAGRQPALEWLLADETRWLTYMAGRTAGYGEGHWDGRGEGYAHGVGVAVKATDGYESGAVAGYETGYLHGAIDQAMDNGPTVMVFRTRDEIEREALAERLPPAETAEGIRRHARESWGLEADTDDAGAEAEDWHATG